MPRNRMIGTLVIGTALCLGNPVAAAEPVNTANSGPDKPQTAGPIKDALATVPLPKVKPGGEYARRLAIHVESLAKLTEPDPKHPEKPAPVDAIYLDLYRTKNATGSLFTSTGLFLITLVNTEWLTGDPRISALRKQVSDTLRECQEPDGYLGPRPVGHRWRHAFDPEDAVNTILGWVLEFRHFGNTAARDAAIKLADNMMQVFPEGTWMAGAGIDMPEAMDQLAALTGDAEYIRYLARTPYPFAMGDYRVNVLNYRWGHNAHAYSVFERTRAQLLLYRHQPAPELMDNFRRTIQALTREGCMWVTGGSGTKEEIKPRVPGVPETCAIVYFNLMLEEKLKLSGNLAFGDLMERSLHNAFFGAQQPNGTIMYHNGLEHRTGGPFRCCEGNFRRLISEVPRMIFLTGDNTIAVNLYTDASAEFDHIPAAGNVVVTQATTYPTGEEIAITIAAERAAEFALKLRLPAWCESPALTINGQPQPLPKGDRVAVIQRRWQQDDKVLLRLPMTVRLVKADDAMLAKAPYVEQTVNFAPTIAKFVRVTLLQANKADQPCLDELEVYAPNSSTNLALAAQGGVATASSCQTNKNWWSVSHLNDGLTGNGCFWMPTENEPWACIELAKPTSIDRVKLSRDRTGRSNDRLPRKIRVELSQDGQTWQSAAEVDGLLGYTPKEAWRVPSVYAGRVAVLRGPQVFGLNPRLSRPDRNSPSVEGNRLIIDPATLTGPEPDDTVRPGGMKLRVKAWTAPNKMASPHDLNLVLTEYPDVNCGGVYLQCSDPSKAVADEFTRFKIE